MRRRPPSPLQTIRKARTLSQRQLAAIVGVEQMTYWRYERGEVIPPPARRARLATVLGTTAEVLWPELVGGAAARIAPGAP